MNTTKTLSLLLAIAALPFAGLRAANPLGGLTVAVSSDGSRLVFRGHATFLDITFARMTLSNGRRDKVDIRPQSNAIIHGRSGAIPLLIFWKLSRNVA